MTSVAARHNATRPLVVCARDTYRRATVFGNLGRATESAVRVNTRRFWSTGARRRGTRGITSSSPDHGRNHSTAIVVTNAVAATMPSATLDAVRNATAAPSEVR